MTSDLLTCLDRANAAERAGDARAALEWHQAVPMLRRGRHRGVLERLARLGDDLPPWLWVRWMAYQAFRCEEPGSGTGEIHRVVLRHAVETFHVDLLEDCYEHGGDPMRVMATVLGESWAFQQVAVHEAGGLVSFVDEFATGRLAEHADLARRWADAPLNGYRIGGSSPGGRLRVYDARATAWVDVLDLGARSATVEAGWVLGRLVPSGVGDLPMFDVSPLAVPESQARRVADAGAERAWAPVTEAFGHGRFDAEALLREDYELATDVQGLDLLRFGTAEKDLERVLQQLRDGRDEVGRAAHRILRGALDGEVEEGDAPFVGAAALDPHGFDETRRSRRSGDREACLRWAELVVEPARGQLLDLGDASGGTADGIQGPPSGV